MRRRELAVVSVIAVSAMTLLGVAWVARFPGGPMQPWPDPHGLATGMHIQAGLPVGRPIYLLGPVPHGVVDATIERLGVEGVSPGLRILGTFVVTHVEETEPPDAGFWLGQPPDGRLVAAPAAISLSGCCEPFRPFAVEFEVDDAGPHSIVALPVDYHSGLFSYHTSLPFGGSDELALTLTDGGLSTSSPTASPMPASIDWLPPCPSPGASSTPTPITDRDTQEAVATLRRYVESLVAGDPKTAWLMLAPEQRAAWPLDTFASEGSRMRGLEACAWVIRPQESTPELVRRWVQIGAGYPTTTAHLADARLVVLDFPTAAPRDNSQWQMWLVAPDSSGTVFLWNLR